MRSILERHKMVQKAFCKIGWGLKGSNGFQWSHTSPASVKTEERRHTSHTPSIQTSPSWSEQEVPSLTLLDMAKKKSKSSAMQYSLQMSSSKHMGKQAHTRRRHCYKRRRGALSEPAGIPPHLNTISWMLTRSLSAVLLLCAQPLLGTELREAESSGGSTRGGISPSTTGLFWSLDQLSRASLGSRLWLK